MSRFTNYAATALMLLSLTRELPAQTVYFVDQSNGNNSHAGTSPAAALRTVEEAADRVLPGDTVSIIGTYANSQYQSGYSFSGDINDPQIWHGQNTFKINNVHGIPSAYVTIRPYDANTVVKGDGANIVRITNSSYIRVEGLDIQGEVDNIPYGTAVALQFLYRESGSTNTLYRVPPGTPEEEIDTMTFPVLSGISRPSYTDTRGFYASNCHHLDIIGNTVHHTPGNGLRVADSDHINIIGNAAYSCARKSYSGTHGLVVSESASIDTTSGYKIFVTHNRVHSNYNEIYSWSPLKTFIVTHIDEGKGISLQKNNSSVTWTHGRIYVANNLAYRNGYSGVHANECDRVDFFNNTAYQNFHTETVTYMNPAPNGNLGISFADGNDVRMVNNIAYTAAGVGNALAAANCTGLVAANNMVFGEIDSDVDGVDVNTIFGDPSFTDTASDDFSLQPTSAAIGAADAGFAPADDFLFLARDAFPDAGAMEYQAALPLDLLAFQAWPEGPDQVRSICSVLPTDARDVVVLERSPDAGHWEDLMKWEAGTVSATPRTFRNTDTSPLPGTSYYRLRLVSPDGTFSYSEMKGVHRPGATGITIRPNPVGDRLVAVVTGSGPVWLLDRQGRPVAGPFPGEGRPDEPFVLDVSALSPGAYLLRAGRQSGWFIKR